MPTNKHELVKYFFKENHMVTVSEIKMKFVMIKSKLLSISKRQKENDYKTILALAFKSRFEADVYTVLRNKWAETHWLFVATGTVLGIIYFLKKILS